MKKAFIYLLLAAIAVSAQQKQRVAVLPSVGDMEPQGLIILTDKVREIATKNLPIDNFTILKQDKIIEMIGEEELYRSCKEGVCIGDLAKKTNTNYGARCDVIKFENSLVLKFELYSVNEDAIFETFTDIDAKDFRGMIASLETRLPDVFKKMASASASKSREVTYKPEPVAPMPSATTLPRAQSGIPTPTKTTFTDSRDGKVYKKVAVGKQVWMAENLNYAAEVSKCYENKSSKCEEYGRLYNWNTANKTCPAGWHLPSDAEWRALESAVGGSLIAGIKLKSASGWYKNGNGTDDFGWSALPGGSGFSAGSFYDAGDYGYWWSATENIANNRRSMSYWWGRSMSYRNWLVYRDYNDETNLFSVRCVQD
jgi:uncharacterized protein (TIGR02145 family)